MNRKKYITFSLIGIIIVIILMIGFTYGFFMSRVKGNNSNSVVLEAGEAELTVQYFDTEDEYQLITPGFTHYQMFTVTNTGNIEVAYSIFLENVINEFVRTNDIIYKLYKVAYEGNVTENTNIFDYNNLNSCVEEPLDINENYSNTCYLVSTNTFPTTKSSIEDVEIIKTPTYKYVYLLKYEYLNSVENQDIDKGHIFRGKIQVYGKDSAEAVNIYNQNTLAYKILDNAFNNLNGTEYSETPKTTPAVTLSGENEATLSKTEENNGYSYYFRGNVENNYVNFNNMCWRIVRIDASGGIKLVLASSSGECSNETLTNDSGYIKNGNTVLTKQYGYKTKQIVTTSGETKTYYIEDYLNSTTGAKKAIEDWFTNNNFDTNKLKTTTWCLGNSTDAYNNQGVKYTLNSSMQDGNGNQYNTVNDYLMGSDTTYYYKNILRMSGYGTTKHATLNCIDEDDQKYTSYIGLLTPDEVALAGGVFGSINNTYYLYDNAQTNYWWLLSHSDFNGTNASDYAFGVYNTGRFSYNYVTNSYALRPAVVLASNIEYVSGDGTVNRPYTINES